MFDTVEVLKRDLGLGCCTMRSVHVRVQGGYCFWGEAVFESVCFSLNAPVAPF